MNKDLVTRVKTSSHVIGVSGVLIGEETMRQEKKIEEILTNISPNQVKEYQHTDPINSVKLIQDKHEENHTQAYYNQMAGKQD